ncbi:MAG: hypothetical protein ACRDRK_04550, partial [Pseudonocardia sp.]
MTAAAGDPRANSEVVVLACEFPGGCPHTLDYGGVGRRPRYCGQSVDGVTHTRYNAHRVNQGTLRLPVPGSRPAVDEVAAARPVSLARASIESLREEIASTLTAHQAGLRELLGRFADTLATVTDPDAAAAEVAAAHREARTAIDTAEAAEQDALTRARAAVAAEQTAQAAQAAAE